MGNGGRSVRAPSIMPVVHRGGSSTPEDDLYIEHRWLELRHTTDDEPALPIDQLPLFSTTAEDAGAKAPALVLMACSASKLARPAAAIDLYQGVMYQSYRVHVRDNARPSVIILSARHGFIDPLA